MRISVLLGCSCLVALGVAPAVAHAQDVVAAPVQAEPSPSEIKIVLGGYSCVVGERGGIDEIDARTIADLLCSELEQQKARAGAYDLRFGRLGSRTLLIVRERASGQERRTFLQTLDEATVALPRVVDALEHRTTLPETQNADNVIAADARAPKTKPIAASGYFGLVGMTGAGVDAGGSAGVDAGLLFRKDRFGFGGHGRAGGIGSGTNKLGFASLDLGGRYALGDGDTAPFVGTGLGISYFQANRGWAGGPGGYSEHASPSGSGFHAYAEGGVEMLRSSRVGLSFSVRADVPFYALKSESWSYSGIGSSASTTTSLYVVPLSLNLGILFR